MRRYIGYFFILFSCMFLCCSKVSAEDVSLSCKYKNPNGGRDFSVTFTNTQNTYTESSSTFAVNNPRFTTCISGSSVGRVYIGDINLGIDRSSVYGGSRWVFSQENFLQKQCESLITRVNGKYTCPNLGYVPVSDSNGNTVYMIYDGNSFTCTPEYGCTPIQQVEGNPEILIDDDGNTSTVKFVDSCDYDLQMGPVAARTKLIFSSYSDGSVTATLGSSKMPVDFNFDLIMNYGTSRVRVPKDILQSVINVGSDNSLTCSKLYLFYDIPTDSYVLTDNFDDIPDNQKNNYTEADPGGDSGNQDNSGSKINLFEGTCTDYLGSASTPGTIAAFLDDIYDVLKVVSILIVIVLSMVEFAKAATNDKDKIPDVVKKLVTRLILLIALLMLPMFVEFILGDGILCGIK